MKRSAFLIPSRKPLQFYRSLAAASAAGIGLLQGIEAAGNTLDPELALNLKARLRRGESLADAMTHLPETFPEWESALVRVGETSGRLDLAFSMLSEILERRRNLCLGMLSRIAAPLLLIHLSPFILEAPVLVNQGVAVYSFAVFKILLRLYIPILALFLAWPWMQNSSFMSRFQRFDSKFRFCTCLIIMVKAGIPLNEALAVSCRAANQPAPPADWEGRETIVERLTRLGIFSQEELSLLQVAEYSGKIEGTLIHIAEQAGTCWQSRGFSPLS